MSTTTRTSAQRAWLISASLVLGLTSSTAHAEPIVDFVTGAVSGAIGRAAGAAALLGRNTSVGQVIGIDTPVDSSRSGAGVKNEPAGTAADPLAEAASLLLLGSGLTAVGAAIRRRPRKGRKPAARRAKQDKQPPI